MQQRRAFWNLVKNNPNKPWDWFYVTQNSQISWDIIEANLMHPLDPFIDRNDPEIWNIIQKNTKYQLNWKQISTSPFITWDIVLAEMSKNQCVETMFHPWCWKKLSCHPNITWDIIVSNLFYNGYKVPWDWFNVSRNPNITWDIIEENRTLAKKYSDLYHSATPFTDEKLIKKYKSLIRNYEVHIPWDNCGIMHNPNTPWEFLRSKIMPTFTFEEVLWTTWASSHPNTTWEKISGCTFIGWDWNHISLNPNITWDIVKSNLDNQWNWFTLSTHPNITWDIIISNATVNYGTEEEPDIKPTPWDWRGISYNPNITWDIIQANPDKPWNWKYASRNPHVTRDIIEANPDKPWDHRMLSNNINFLKIFDDYGYFNLYYTSRHQAITWDIIQRYPTYYFNWYCVSQNPNITWDIIRSNLYFKSDGNNSNPKYAKFSNNSIFRWKLRYLTGNPSIRWNDIKTSKAHPFAHPLLHDYRHRSYTEIERKCYGLPNLPDITWNFFKLNFFSELWPKSPADDTIPKKVVNPWDWEEISCHPNITWKIISENKFISTEVPETFSEIPTSSNLNYVRIPWDMCGVSRNPNNTWDIIQNNPNEEWDWKGISMHQNITWDIIQDNQFLIIKSDNLLSETHTIRTPWDWEHISLNPNITWDIIQANLDNPWDWECISRNPNITWGIIQANPDKPWNWENISQNENITADIVMSNLTMGWDFVKLSQNNMDQPYFRTPQYNKHLANKLVSTIIDELRMVIYHPRRHPANHTALCDLVDHPFEFLKQDELQQII